MIKEKLIEKEGYCLLEHLIPNYLITSFNKRLEDLYPVRASSKNKIYAEKNNIKNLSDISVWWSQSVDEFPELMSIKRIIDPLIIQNFTNLSHYVSDVVTINPKTNWINPHVDTPNRFKKWNYDKSLLGIQCIVALKNFDNNYPSTGIVPYSQKRDFDIDKCYNGFYDSWFNDNYIQPIMPAGSLLIYNSRLLHSSMPNNSDIPRSALLLNYLDTRIIDEVTKIDNVWASNG